MPDRVGRQRINNIHDNQDKRRRNPPEHPLRVHMEEVDELLEQVSNAGGPPASAPTPSPSSSSGPGELMSQMEKISSFLNNPATTHPILKLVLGSTGKEKENVKTMHQFLLKNNPTENQQLKLDVYIKLRKFLEENIAEIDIDEHGIYADLLNDMENLFPSKEKQEEINKIFR